MKAPDSSNGKMCYRKIYYTIFEKKCIFHEIISIFVIKTKVVSIFQTDIFDKY